MARVYRVSADTSEKEKIIGGVLELEQGIWIGIGLLVIVGILIPMSNVVPLAVALLIALPPGLGIALPFAFYKKQGLSLRLYLGLKRSFKKKSKYLINTLNYKA